MHGIMKQMQQRHHGILNGLLRQIDGLQGELTVLRDSLQESQSTLQRIHISREEHKISSYYRSILKCFGQLAELQSYELPFKNNLRRPLTNLETLTLPRKDSR